MIKVKRPFGYYDTALGIIGRTGENDTRTIDFDCTAALEEYSDANIICVCLRPGDDEPYTIPLSTDGDHRILTLASADLEKEGRLTLELRMVDGDKVLKSARFTGTIASSLQGEGDAPGTPVRDTLDRLDAEIKAAQAVVDDIRAKLDAGEFDGADGYSPSATVSKDGATTTISITDKTGTTTATVEDGAKGDPGSDASVTVENIQSALGYAPVKDVQVAGSSVLVGDVANIKANPYQGVSFDSLHEIVLYPAGTDVLNPRVSNRAITPTNLDYAVKAAMCDGKGAAWTENEQKAARERMGTDGNYVLIEETVLTEETTQFERAQEPDGTPYNFSAIRVVVKFIRGQKNGTLVLYGSNNGKRIVGGASQVLVMPSPSANPTYRTTAVFNARPGYGGYYDCETAAGSQDSGMMVTRAVNGSYTMTETGKKIQNIIFYLYSSESATMIAGTEISIYGVRA